MLPGVTPQWLRGMFGRIAPRYDLTNTLISAGLDRYWRRCLARHVAAVPVQRVLDVACGTGRVMVHVAQHCPTASPIVGVDFTEAMIRVGRARLCSHPSVRRLRFCVGDAQALPCADGSFDVVTMMFGVRNFDDPMQGLGECWRVLSPGGRLCLIEFSWPHRMLVRCLYAGYFRYVLPLLAWPLSGERAAYRYLRDSVLAFRSRTALPELLQRIGFQEIAAKPLSGGITTLYTGRKIPGEPL
jgi:demethylmenaquinone methyltransferase / 2-methoxy-6-polyprenyl-1,4-benzoquinol methylase